MDGKVRFLVDQMKSALESFVVAHERLTKAGSSACAEASTQLTTVRRGKHWIGRTAAYNHHGLNVYVSVEVVVTNPGTKDDDNLFATDDGVRPSR